jgi:hypothetical protein
MEFEQLVKEVFSNIRGERLMDELNKMYVQRMSYVTGNSPEETAFREGQKDVVLFLNQLLEN